MANPQYKVFIPERDGRPTKEEKKAKRILEKLDAKAARAMAKKIDKENKPWDMAKADKEFSLYIRRRDNRCMHPKCKNPLVDVKKLQNSHFWSRGVWVTRFDPRNCVAACAGCHHFKWEGDKNGTYREFMIRWLGKAEYNKMEKLVNEYKGGKIKTTHRAEILKVRKFLEDLQK